MQYSVLYRIHQKLTNKTSYDPNRYQEFVDWLIPPKDNKDVPPKLSGQVSVLRFPTGFYFTVILYGLLRQTGTQIEKQIKKQSGREGTREEGREGRRERERERERKREEKK